MLLLEHAVDLGSFSQGEEDRIQKLAERIASEKPAVVSISGENGGYKVRASEEVLAIDDRFRVPTKASNQEKPDYLTEILAVSALMIKGADVEEVILKKSQEPPIYEVYLLRK